MPKPEPAAHRAALRLRVGQADPSVRIRVTPAGLAVIAGPVSSMHLSTAGLVQVASTPARRHPLLTLIRQYPPGS